MTLTYISCSSDFYTFYVNIPLSLGCMIRKVSAEDIAIRGNGTGMEYMCPTRHFVYIFFNPVFQVSTAKNEINLFNNHVLIVAPVTFAPAGAMTPSAEFLFITFFLPASVAQLDAPSDWRPGGHGFNPRRGRQHSFVEIDHEIFSTVILSLPLIKEGQFSVSGERTCTILVNRLED